MWKHEIDEIIISRNEGWCQLLLESNTKEFWSDGMMGELCGVHARDEGCGHSFGCGYTESSPEEICLTRCAHVINMNGLLWLQVQYSIFALCIAIEKIREVLWVFHGDWIGIMEY